MMKRYLQFDNGVANGELHAPERGRFDEASMPEGRVMVDVTDCPHFLMGARLAHSPAGKRVVKAADCSIVIP